MHVPMLDAAFVGDSMTTRNVLTGVTGLKLHPRLLCNPTRPSTPLDQGSRSTPLGYSPAMGLPGTAVHRKRSGSSAPQPPSRRIATTTNESMVTPLVRRLDFGYFVRPADESGTGDAR